MNNPCNHTECGTIRCRYVPTATQSPEPLLARIHRKWSNAKTHWHNLKNWKVAWAYQTITEAMQKDPDYAHSWQCNIAIPILDNCNEKLSPKECNFIADVLMKHLFGVQKKVPKVEILKIRPALNSPEVLDYLKRLKSGEEVVECDPGHGFYRCKGTVYHQCFPSLDVCVTWHLPDGKDVGTSITWGTRRLTDVVYSEG